MTTTAKTTRLPELMTVEDVAAYLRGPVYAVRWRSDGKRQYGTVATLTEARDLRARVEGRKASGQSTDYSRRRETLANWWPRYESSRAANRLTTRDRDRSLWRNHLLSALGDVQVGAIRAADVEDLQEDLLASPLGPATVSKIVTLLSSVLDLAVRDQVLDTNPARLVRRVRVDQPEARFLELSQVADLEAVMHPWWRMTVPLMVTTALRIGEVAALRVCDVHLLAGSVRVTAGSDKPGGVRGRTKTAAGGRTVPTLPRDLCDQLSQMIADRGLAPNDHLFTGPDGGVLTPGNFRKRVWRPAVAKAGLEGVTPHALRHTAISICLAQGVEPFRVARWAGQASTTFLQRTYGHLLPDAEADRRRDELGALLDPGPGQPEDRDDTETFMTDRPDFETTLPEPEDSVTLPGSTRALWDGQSAASCSWVLVDRECLEDDEVTQSLQRLGDDVRSLGQTVLAQLSHPQLGQHRLAVTVPRGRADRGRGRCGSADGGARWQRPDAQRVWFQGEVDCSHLEGTDD